MRIRKELVEALMIVGMTAVTSVGAQSLSDKTWGLQAQAGVDAPGAWNLMKSKGDCSKSGVIVAVIDTGIDVDHPALKDVLWTNTKEANGKVGVDNDGDGYINDIHGWDFARNSGKLVDKHGHGTHIAGIIAASEKREGGLKGVCPGVRIMALRYYDENASGSDNLRNTIKAIEYAVAHGANIINYSGGGAERSNAEFQALKMAEARGILVVAAAGNERSNVEELGKAYFPASYELNNILAVTALDPSGNLLSSSNYGPHKVHVAAPGQSILSSTPNGGYGYMSGTSQATAFVSGVAAMLLSENSSLTVRQLKSFIEGSVMKSPKLLSKTISGGRVNAEEALVRMRSQSGRRAASSR